MAEEEKIVDQFGFIPAGESLGYISLEQAGVLAMRTAREIPGEYGSSYQGIPMALDRL